MNDTKNWPTLAGQRLENAPHAKKIAGIYTGILLGMSLLVTAIRYGLDLSIAQTSGLGNLGKQNILSTIQTLLPLIQSAIVMCLDLGFVAAMLRISRGQYASPNSLRLGFDRFWVLLRTTILKSGLYTLVCLPVAYLTLSIYMLTPLGDGMVDALIPMMTQTSLTDALYDQMLQAMAPCLVVCCCTMAIAMLVLSYRYRMANYILIDKPGTKAMAVLRQSRKMMKGNGWKLFRLDLRLWWYYAALALTSVVGYLDVLLPALGISLPLSADGSYYLSYGLSLVVTGLTYLFLRSRAEVVYGFAYDAIKPQEPETNGVVLGNIFQM